MNEPPTNTVIENHLHVRCEGGEPVDVTKELRFVGRMEVECNGKPLGTAESFSCFAPVPKVLWTKPRRRLP